jgi:hypothetical protein
MMAIDANCDCWVVQDKTPAILRIDQRSHVAEQIPVPLPEHWMQMTGPAVVTAPDGGVWCSLLGGDGALVRICPVTKKKTRYHLVDGSGEDRWLKSQRFIHMQFVEVPGKWLIFNKKKVRYQKMHLLVLLSSNLIDDTAINAITLVYMNMYVGSGWVAFASKKEIPLPTQDCSCHRVEIIKDKVEPHQITAVISEMASSRIFQIQLHHIEAHTFMIETEDKDGEFTVYSYTGSGGTDSKRKNENYFRAFEGWKQSFNKYETHAQCDDEGAIWLPDPSLSAEEFGMASPEAAAAYEDMKNAYRGLTAPRHLADC